MQFRHADENDIPGIVRLLKESLGEGLMPKSEAYWRWKHIDNPFGASPVMIASDEEKIVGVRAFMRWNWQNVDEIIPAVRAVDTATHPNYQGKGIFTKLTKSILSDCERSGIKLVFNTPNSQSKPGYLKMGWEDAGRLPVKIRIRRPFRLISRMIFEKKASIQSSNDGSLLSQLDDPQVAILLRQNAQLHRRNFISAHTVETLKWRFNDVPVTSYFAAKVSNPKLTAMIFYRLKPSRFGIEMRVADCFISSLDSIRSVRKIIDLKAREHKADFVAISSKGSSAFLNGLSFSRFLGPEVTVRNVASNEIERFKNFNEWDPSIGDLELF